MPRMQLKENSKGTVTPGIKVKINPEEEEELSESMKTRYRALVARANYLSQDRPDIQYDAKELCRDMSNHLHAFYSVVKLNIFLQNIQHVVFFPNCFM